MTTTTTQTYCQVCGKPSGGGSVCAFCLVKAEEAPMKFGRYRGRRLGGLPAGYAKWLLANVPLTMPMRQALEDLVRRRESRAAAHRGRNADAAAAQRQYR
jgi:hypothetical protein